MSKEYRRDWYQKNKARLREQRRRKPVPPDPAYLEAVQIGFGLVPEKDLYGDEPIFSYPQWSWSSEPDESDEFLAFLLETETD